MTTDEKITMAKSLMDNDAQATDEVVMMYLSVAREVILRTKYPFGVPVYVYDVGESYEMLQCQLAARYFYRFGADGEIAHSENGISRNYASPDDADLLAQITPMAKVLT